VSSGRPGHSAPCFGNKQKLFVHEWAARSFAAQFYFVDLKATDGEYRCHGGVTYVNDPPIASKKIRVPMANKGYYLAPGGPCIP